jgi:3-hydroxybutyryl-CoA dehydrogenase
MQEEKMEIKTFGVIGAGQMGGGIAQVAAMSGLDVVMNDIKTEFVECPKTIKTRFWAESRPVWI